MRLFLFFYDDNDDDCSHHPGDTGHFLFFVFANVQMTDLTLNSSAIICKRSDYLLICDEELHSEIIVGKQNKRNYRSERTTIMLTVFSKLML